MNCLADVLWVPFGGSKEPLAPSVLPACCPRLASATPQICSNCHWGPPCCRCDSCPSFLSQTPSGGTLHCMLEPSTALQEHLLDNMCILWRRHALIESHMIHGSDILLQTSLPSIYPYLLCLPCRAKGVLYQRKCSEKHLDKIFLNATSTADNDIHHGMLHQVFELLSGSS